MPRHFLQPQKSVVLQTCVLDGSHRAGCGARRRLPLPHGGPPPRHTASKTARAAGGDATVRSACVQGAGSSGAGATGQRPGRHGVGAEWRRCSWCARLLRDHRRGYSDRRHGVAARPWPAVDRRADPGGAGIDADHLDPGSWRPRLRGLRRHDDILPGRAHRRRLHPHRLRRRHLWRRQRHSDGAHLLDDLRVDLVRLLQKRRQEAGARGGAGVAAVPGDRRGLLLRELQHVAAAHRTPPPLARTASQRPQTPPAPRPWTRPRAPQTAAPAARRRAVASVPPSHPAS